MVVTLFALTTKKAGHPLLLDAPDCCANVGEA